MFCKAGGIVWVWAKAEDVESYSGATKATQLTHVVVKGICDGVGVKRQPSLFVFNLCSYFTSNHSDLDVWFTTLALLALFRWPDLEEGGNYF